MDPRLRAVAEAAKGFMPPEEGEALYQAGLRAAAVGPLLEIGTYCGKSAVYLGAAASELGTVLYTIDHHRGSEEMQSGWDHHDEDLMDPETGRMNSFPFFKQTMNQAELNDVVIAIVGESATIAQNWTTQMGLVFIDGAHSEEPAFADYEGWAPKIATGGLLAIHDVFTDPKDGGRGPYRVFERAVSSGDFVEERAEGSLRVLRRET